MVLPAAALVSLLLSLLGKALADHLLTSRVPVIGSFAGLQYAKNSGVAFSITFPGPLQWLLIAAAVGLLAWSARYAKTSLGKAGFGMILGGALGNIADRLGDGFVTDFLQVGTFPIFNIADSFITIGVFLIIWEAFMMRRR
jgi:signal peptidase II